MDVSIGWCDEKKSPFENIFFIVHNIHISFTSASMLTTILILAISIFLYGTFYYAYMPLEVRVQYSTPSTTMPTCPLGYVICTVYLRLRLHAPLGTYSVRYTFYYAYMPLKVRIPYGTFFYAYMPLEVRILYSIPSATPACPLRYD